MREQGVDGGGVGVGPGRWARGVATFLLGTHAVLLVITLPVVLLVLLFSLWEGGDEAMKQRLHLWAPLDLLATVPVVVLLGCAAWAVRRRSPDSRTFLALATGGALALGAGWAWVGQRQLVTDPSLLGTWLVLTLPGPLAAALVHLGGRRTAAA
jgi:hypothetical protein